ncbi:MAG: hypothetical protein ACD_39C01667G0001 [uncultured bacterium]|nr:MAG: hypothetical protein ACD_39C01667G0001 [uncultured bacterium]
MNKRIIEIKKWLLENNIKQVDIAKKAGVSGSAVSLVIRGKATSANIKRVFLEFGCPEKIWTEEVS